MKLVNFHMSDFVNLILQPSDPYVFNLEIRMWCRTLQKALHKPSLKVQFFQVENNSTIDFILAVPAAALSMCMDLRQDTEEHPGRLSDQRDLIYKAILQV